jgi:hypothetical protein
MTRIYEADKFNAGPPQLILENKHISVLLQPEIGGRILDVEMNDFPFLHRTYPKSVQFGAYTEYGGIEECIGSPLRNRLWKTPWRVEKGTGDVTLSVISPTRFGRVPLSKTLSLEPTAPILRVEYSFTNFDQQFNKFTFGIHPELCLGNALKNNTYHLPLEDQLLSGGFTELGFKKFVTPDAGWGAVTYDGMAFGMLFPPGLIDNLEIYYPRIGTHFVIQPLIYGVGLSPNRRASFVSMFYFGEGDVDTIRDLYTSKIDELTMNYGPIDAFPERTIKEAQWEPQAAFSFNQFRQPTSQPGATHPEAANPNETEEPDALKLVSERQRFDHPQITDIRLSNVNGTILVEGWKEDSIALETTVQAQAETDEEIKRQIEDARPEVIQRGERLMIRARDEAQQKITVNQHLRVPQHQLHALELNFVNGAATIIDVKPDRLKINSATGVVTIRGEIAESAEYDINTASGDIQMELVESVACTINANSVTGVLKCDPDLIDAEVRSNWISGILNAPKANLRLNSISGNIVLANANRGKVVQQKDKTATTTA